MILNITQHDATSEQITAGVVDLYPTTAARVRALLTFDVLPTAAEIDERAAELAAIAAAVLEIEYDSPPDDPCPVPSDHHVMIGGAPYLMSALEIALRRLNMQPVYAFSTRDSVESVQPDGSVRKTQVFRHAGFVAARAMRRNCGG